MNHSFSIAFRVSQIEGECVLHELEISKAL